MAHNKNGFDIHKMVEEVYSLYTFAAAERGLRYTYSVSHKIPKNISGDFDAVKKAFSAIVNIAIEKSNNGAVELTVDPIAFSGSTCTIKFSVNENSMRVPYWFAVTFAIADDPFKLRKIS